MTKPSKYWVVVNINHKFAYRFKLPVVVIKKGKK